MLDSILHFRRRHWPAFRGCHNGEEVISIERVRALATEAALALPFDMSTVMLGNMLSGSRPAAEFADAGQHRSSRRARRCA